MSKPKVIADEEFKYDLDTILKTVKKVYGTIIDPNLIKDLIPPGHSKYVVRYTSMPTCLANGWRRTILDDIIYPRLSTSMLQIESDDPFVNVMTDDIQNQIWQTPCSYLNPNTDVSKFSAEIYVENKTQNVVVVTTSDINNIKNLPKNFSYELSTRLCKLAPGRFIRIPININFGKSEDYVSYGQFGPVKYLPFKYDIKIRPPSYTVIPTNYDLGLLKCHSYIQASDAITLGWNTVHKMLESSVSNLQTLLEEKELYVPYVSNNGELHVTYDLQSGEYHYKFHKQCQTLGEILFWYTFNQKNVSFIVSGKESPKDTYVRIKIKLIDSVETTIKSCAEELLTAAFTAIKRVEKLI